MEKYSRKSVFESLKDYCYLSKDNDFMEVTEWNNGEGFDVCIDSNRNLKNFSLTFGEFQLLQVLVNIQK